MSRGTACIARREVCRATGHPTSTVQIPSLYSAFCRPAERQGLPGGADQVVGEPEGPVLPAEYGAAGGRAAGAAGGPLLRLRTDLLQAVLQRGGRGGGGGSGAARPVHLQEGEISDKGWQHPPAPLPGVEKHRITIGRYVFLTLPKILEIKFTCSSGKELTETVFPREAKIGH